MVEIRRFLGLVRLATLGFAVVAGFGTSPARAQSCASPAEFAALNARVLQTDLMVAALACGYTEQYNDFVRRFQGPLARSGEALRAHHRSEARLNAFATRLANEASQRHLGDPGGFCAAAAALAAEAMTVDPGNFATLTSKPELATRHGVSACR